MFSPHERLYTTPDVSVPAAEAILQQLRLERILKRFGYLACCKAREQVNDIVAPPLVTLGPPAPTRGLRPFGAHEAFTGWQRSKNIQIPKPKVCSKVLKSRIPGAPVKDPYLPYQRDDVGRLKLTKYGIQDVQRPELFKPFQPIKSPPKLPSIKRERGNEFESKLQATDFYKHMKWCKSRNTELIKEGKKSKKKRKKEMEFMKWEASREQYYDKSVTDLCEYVNNRDKDVHNGVERKYREKIETQIKQGVKQRVESFGQSGTVLTKGTPKHNALPVLELEFEHKNLREKRIFRK